MYKFIVSEVFSLKKIKWTELLISVASAELVGVLSALLSGDFSTRYSQLIQPPLAPSEAVFPVVWAILYALMGISAYIIWQSADSTATAKKLYLAQLAVNFLWSIIFFRFELLGLAAIWAVLLFLLVAATVKSFGKKSPTAALLNLPYLLWSAFAAYLAIGTWALNR